MPSNHRVAVYTGVFDPVHLGHLDVIRRGANLMDRLIVGVGDNPEKSSFFTVAERVDLLQKVVQPFANVEVKPFAGLAVQFVREMGARDARGASHTRVESGNLRGCALRGRMDRHIPATPS